MTKDTFSDTHSTILVDLERRRVVDGTYPHAARVAPGPERPTGRVSNDRPFWSRHRR
jgi:hypothetical protein